MKTFDRPNLEVADIFHKFGHLLGPLPLQQRKVVNAIVDCRTAVLGGNRQKCDHCGNETQSYNSCRNRHCPKCQFLARAKWIDSRTQDLLPCQYFHVVFTVPSELKPLILRNQRTCYDAIFKAASETLKEVAANDKHLGAEIGCIGVLHTWAQNLIDHPHVHILVPGGGLSADKSRWLASKKGFFLPVRVLSKVFRGKLLEMIERAYHGNKLQFGGHIAPLQAPQCFQEMLTQCASKEFVVYSKEPFAGPKQVMSYLGQYTHRIAISNYRLVKLEGEEVTFKVRDKTSPGSKKLLTLNAREFMRRFLLHVLPKGYVRIRHFGMLASRYKAIKLAIIRKLIGAAVAATGVVRETWQQLLERVTGIDVARCPVCGIGRLSEKTILPRRPRLAA